MTKEMRSQSPTLGKDYEPIIQKLVDWLEEDKQRLRSFEESINSACSNQISEFDYYGITSARTALNFADDLLRWMPRENENGQDLNFRMAVFYFCFNQPPFQQYQTPIDPKSADGKLSWLSRWLREYAAALGDFLDTTESINEHTLETFRQHPKYRLDDYIEPRGGWKTFNQFFARAPKPGARPIHGLYDDSIIVNPTDCTFEDSWQVEKNSKVVLKGIQWDVEELLENSPYRDMFKGGVWMHSFLDVADYHRQNAPVSGYVREARIIEGQAYLKTTVESHSEEEGNKLVLRRDVDSVDDAGYQFLQMRGLIILESPLGFVGVLPVGMGHVSSVVLTAEEGRWLHKGEEISYFQYGGSDIILLFQEKAQVELVKKTVPPSHYFMGEFLGTGKVTQQPLAK